MTKGVDDSKLSMPDRKPLGNFAQGIGWVGFSVGLLKGSSGWRGYLLWDLDAEQPFSLS
jgi:hypothetical protein